MANSVYPDEMADYEPANLYLHCLHRYLYRSTRLKILTLSMLGKIFSRRHLEYFIIIIIPDTRPLWSFVITRPNLGVLKNY